jgi:hypothetical protein
MRSTTNGVIYCSIKWKILSFDVVVVVVVVVVVFVK